MAGKVVPVGTVRLSPVFGGDRTLDGFFSKIGKTGLTNRPSLMSVARGECRFSVAGPVDNKFLWGCHRPSKNDGLGTRF